MTARFVLAPEAANDLVQIWRYIKKQTSVEMADNVESVIRDKILYLSTSQPPTMTTKYKPPAILA